MVNSNGKFNYTYGYLEARVWLSGTGAISNWPAVWTDGQSWPADGELDVMEGLSASLLALPRPPGRPRRLLERHLHRRLAHLRRRLGTRQRHLLLRRRSGRDDHVGHHQLPRCT